MSWKEILKNYKPLAHAVEGAKKEGKEKIWGKIADAKYAPKYYGDKTKVPYEERFNNPNEAGKYEKNFGLTRLDTNLRNPTPRGQGWNAQGLRSKNLVLTNSDGSPRTVTQHNEEYGNTEGMNKWLGRLDVNRIKRLGKNPDTMTLQEYVQLREEGKL